MFNYGEELASLYEPNQGIVEIYYIAEFQFQPENNKLLKFPCFSA
jgi:hypothetical protein